MTWVCEMSGNDMAAPEIDMHGQPTFHYESHSISTQFTNLTSFDMPCHDVTSHDVY